MQTETKVSKRIQNLIEKNNAVYKAASRKERKELILKDTLALIRLQNSPVTIGRQGYCSKTNTVNQETLLSNDVSCTVCARGALMCSKIKIGNKYSFEENFDIDQSTTTEVLKDAFTATELELIESIFEKGCFVEKENHNLTLSPMYKRLRKLLCDEEEVKGGYYDLDQDIYDFSDRYYAEDHTERMKQICNNILKADCDVYKGLFTNVLEKAKKKK